MFFFKDPGKKYKQLVFNFNNSFFLFNKSSTFVKVICEKCFKRPNKMALEWKSKYLKIFFKQMKSSSDVVN